MNTNAFPTKGNLMLAKNSRGSGDIFHEANTPVKTITDDSSNIATEIPSTPTE